MGREIEVKIPLNKKEYDFIYSFIYKTVDLSQLQIASKVEKLFKKDEYFSRYDNLEERKNSNEPQCVRLRTEAVLDDSDSVIEERSFFTLKRKTRQNGIEVNREDETEISDADVIRQLMEISGYHIWFKKIKNAISVYCKSEFLKDVNFHLELENVNDLLYVEVEVTDESKDPEEIKEALNQFVKALNLDPEKKDSRSWVKILSS